MNSVRGKPLASKEELKYENEFSAVFAYLFDWFTACIRFGGARRDVDDQHQ